MRASPAESGTTSSGAKPETKFPAEPAVTPSVTKMEDTTFAAPNTSKPEHVTTTNETLDNPSPDIETDDNGTSVPVPDSRPNSETHKFQGLPPSASSLQLPRFRIHGKREAAVKLEKNVKPRIELLEKDELFVSSQLQRSRNVNHHGTEGIGPHTFLCSASNCQQTEPRSEGDGHLRRVSDEQGVALSFGMSWKDLVTFATKPHSSRNLICFHDPHEWRSEFASAGSREQERISRCEVCRDLELVAVRSSDRRDHHRDIIKMRWVLRHKESGKPKARLVIIGYHDARVCSEVRAEAPMASRRGRSLSFSWPQLTTSCPLRQATSRACFCRRRSTTSRQLATD